MKAESSSEISRLIGVIEEVLSQTNDKDDLISKMTSRLADVAQDEDLLQLSLESALQSATELRDGPEDVLPQA